MQWHSKFKGHSHCSVTASTKEKAKKAKNKRVFFKTKAEIKSDTVEKLMWRLHLDHCHPSGHQFIIISQSIPLVSQVHLAEASRVSQVLFYRRERDGAERVWSSLKKARRWAELVVVCWWSSRYNRAGFNWKQEFFWGHGGRKVGAARQRTHHSSIRSFTVWPSHCE